ncbi:5-(carboxyamino)imidazole ribonucleotide synthase [Rhodovibrio salinarum]|uniref:N5-carboxyaminoimidazole ribonucleotide synthase n=1 Tax=Rhodovibrio salinarum TaxID=1087 RepID=A0A934UYJ0_9PROT|nr:5-(carboxyamino)imidazole ribonucleotide synthase [Rhodovibrio salinarum]MBK1695893.1 5-(carboxyamino)imidazole ribonucleotide synthase [Rhodovibrio salinarum]
MSDPLAPGSVIGILGGGQLGRMAALAAYPLGYRVHVYTPKADDPATQVTDRTTIASYDDAEALAAFAQAVDVVTYEFENVPARTAEILGESVPLRPRPGVLAICQDRLKEKDFLRDHGIPTTDYAEVTSAQELADALADGAIGRPAVLKTVRGGYDGKGQLMIAPDSDAEAAWSEMAGTDAQPVGILEAFVDYALEASVIVARGVDGQIASYVPVENRHEHHILSQTIAPADLNPTTAQRATDTAEAVARAIDLVGVMGVELFVTHDGDVLVNELAPRPHNSGHWTIDACPASQFEQFIRAVAGLPLAPCTRHSDAVMDNLLGDEAGHWLEIAREGDARLHLYGKAEARPGRKMGHVTRLKPRSGT